MQRTSLLLLSAFLIVGTSVTALMGQTNTVVTFDSPAPVGSPDAILNGIFQGIDFGTGQWRWSGPFGSDFTNSIYFDSSVGTSRSFSFPSGRRILNAVNVYALESGTLTLSDDAGQGVTRSVLVGSMQLVTTGWSLPSNTVTLSFSAGWSLGVDDIAYTNAVPSDNESPVISISSPSSGSVVFGTVSISASASDNAGVSGVQFLLDGIKLGDEDRTAPYQINWNTTMVLGGSYTLTAIARDAAGNQSTSSPVTIIVDNMPGGNPNYTLRFFGNGVNDIDRVKIQIDDPANSAPGPPADVGATDFTVEFWMNASVGENTSPAVQCGNNNWIYGNIIFDRDRYNQDRSYGISLSGGRLVFGVSGDGTGSQTICGVVNVLDNQWHHVAAQRRRADGWMGLYVDGILEAQADGPDGDISYPDNGVPGNFCGPGGNQPCTNSDPYLVIGAEKHDAGRQFPSYSGWIDEVRLSNILRYGSAFTRPSKPFTPDVSTVALYHLDAGQGDLIIDSSNASGGPSNGVRRYGGLLGGPQWVESTFFVPSAPAPSPIVLPVLTSISPTSVVVGGSAFTLLVNGTNFVNGSVVRWNGAGRTTTFVSATQLTAAIPAGDIAAARTAQVTVFNPAPGGGTSTAQTFTISVTSNGLIAAYGFNEGGGTGVGDETGNGNGGTIAGANWTTAGRFGNGLSFNGVNSMVTINDANSLDLAGEMTLEAWVYPTVAPSGWQPAVVKERPTGSAYYLYASSSGSNLPATGVDVEGEQSLFAAGQLTANTWTHLVRQLRRYDAATLREWHPGGQSGSDRCDPNFSESFADWRKTVSLGSSFRVSSMKCASTTEA